MEVEGFRMLSPNQWAEISTQIESTSLVRPRETWCLVENKHGYVCTRPAGHPGFHITHTRKYQWFGGTKRERQ